uniref:glutaminase n=1 Tax=Lepeophtheirus salmonis TaxID=72036 RepID=A0A0K2U2A2_LEPSM
MDSLPQINIENTELNILPNFGHQKQQINLTECESWSDISQDDRNEDDFLFASLYEDDKISIKLFLEMLDKAGLRTSDPRLSGLMSRLNILKPQKYPYIKSLKLDTNTFKHMVSESGVLFNKVFQNKLIISDFESFKEKIVKIYQECLMNTTGQVIDQKGPNKCKWSVSICTVDGQRLSLGCATDPFTMKDLCKPILYAICMENLGEQVVHKYQGREPSGHSSKEIVLDCNNKPYNPLVESGGIMSSSLILQKVKPELTVLSEKYEYVQQCFDRMAGGEYIGFNNVDYLAQRIGMDQQKAVAYFMRENKCFPEDNVNIDKTLDFNAQIQALEVNSESNAVIAATLANGGICPIKSEKILEQTTVNCVLSLMYTCGLHLSAGEFAFNIGLPAISSGHGALTVVIPNVMGISLWSPMLDSLDNSIRGMEFCKKLIDIFSFHRFDCFEQMKQSRLQKIDPTLSHKPINQFYRTIGMIQAAAKGDLDNLKLAYLQNSNINNADGDDRTALHLACAEGHTNCIQFLLYQCAANPFLADRWGVTAATEAQKSKKEEVQQIMKDYLLNHSKEHLDDDRERELLSKPQNDEPKLLKLITTTVFKDKIGLLLKVSESQDHTTSV